MMKEGRALFGIFGALVVAGLTCLGCLGLVLLAKRLTPGSPAVAQIVPAEILAEPTQIPITQSETPLPVSAKATNTPLPPTPARATDTPVPTSLPKPSATATRTAPRVFSFGDGAKIVGSDIPPGTYRSTTGSSCYWERLSGFGGTLGEILANDNAVMPTIVTIAATDKGFNSKRCSEWTQDLSTITTSPTAPFGAGTYFVNKDIAPGTWRSTGGEGCYWERLRGFGGTLADIISNDNSSGSAIVTINSGDVGFASKRCGTWTKIK